MLWEGNRQPTVIGLGWVCDSGEKNGKHTTASNWVEYSALCSLGAGGLWESKAASKSSDDTGENVRFRGYCMEITMAAGGFCVSQQRRKLSLSLGISRWSTLRSLSRRLSIFSAAIVEPSLEMKRVVIW